VTGPETRTIARRPLRPTRMLGPMRLVRGLLRKPLGIVAAVYLIVVIALAALAPLVAPASPTKPDLRSTLQGPSAAHWLGTDALGQDVLSRLLYGAGDTLIGVLQALLVWLLIGVPVGIIAGYIGGMTDRVITRAIDVVLAVPTLIVTLAALAVFGSSLAAGMIVFGILGAANLARIVRASVLIVREELYVDAARIMGLSTSQILWRHVLPRTVGVIIVQAALFAAIALGVQTGLAFLGFGPPPPAPTWGGMVAEATTLLQRHPWLLVPSGAAVGLTALALGLLGDALRDVDAERRSAGGERVPRRAEPAVATADASDRDDEMMLQVRELTIGFRIDGEWVTVVERASFDIAASEIVGLVGESGSGKTVTALALLGLLPPSGRILGGSIRFRGRELVGLDERGFRTLRGNEIAMISQEPMVALDPSFTIGAQLSAVVRTHERGTRRAAKRRALELLTEVGLPDPAGIAKLHPHQISGGMAQRVVIACALAGRPSLLIADEPTTALDVTIQAGILDLLDRLRRDNGMAVLLVTHNWGVVADVCQRAVVMYAGHVVERAEVVDMFTNALHPYTLGLLRSNPHLAMRGEPLPTIGGMVPAPSDWPPGCHFAARCPMARPDCADRAVVLRELLPERHTACHYAEDLVPGKQVRA